MALAKPIALANATSETKHDAAANRVLVMLSTVALKGGFLMPWRTAERQVTFVRLQSLSVGVRTETPALNSWRRRRRLSDVGRSACQQERMSVGACPRTPMGV